MKCEKLFALCAILLTVGAPQAHADPVIFSTLGVGDSYATNAAFVIGSNFDIRQGEAFTPSASGRLSSLELGLTSFSLSGSRQTVLASLMTDDGGLPGRIIETFVFGGDIPNNPDSALLLVNSVTRPELMVGVTYWLILSRGDVSTNVGWNFAALGLTTTSHYLVIGDEPPRIAFNSRGAFRLTAEADPIPEPATLLLFASGAAGIWAQRRARLKGFRG
jgi:hypothetical protein